MDKDKLIDNIVMRELENTMILNMPSNNLNNYIEIEKNKEEKCNILRDNSSSLFEELKKASKKM